MASNESSPANRYHCPFECGKSYTRRRDCLPHLLKQQPDPDQHHRGEEKWSSDDVQHLLSQRRLPNANRYHCPFECGKSFTRRRDCLPHLLKQQPDPDQHHRGEEKWSSDDVQHFLSPRRLPNGVKCDVERRKELRRIWNENYYKVQQKLRAARRKRLHEAPQQHTSVPSYDTEGK